jgi:Na+/H+-translocating membrane pyrophosphatase
LGWDWLREKQVGITFEMGIVDQGPPKVSLDAYGPIASDPDFQADLAAEEAELRESVDDLDIYPYASFGVAIRF